MTDRQWQLHRISEVDGEWASKIADFLRSFAVDGRNRKTISPEYFSWKLRDNPVEAGIAFAAMDGDEIVGLTTATPKPVSWKGSEIAAYEIGDTFTSPTHQRQGIFSSLVRSTVDAATSDRPALIYGTPNENSLPGYEAKLSFLRVPSIDNWLWLLPIRTGINLSAADKLPIDLLSAPLSAASRVGYRTLTVANRAMTRAGASSHGSFDAQKAALARSPLAISRTSDYLDYRIGHNPEADRYQVVRSSDGLVISKDTSQQGMRVLFVADALAHSPASERRLWANVVEQATRERYDTIATWRPRGTGRVPLLAGYPAIPTAKKEVIVFRNEIGNEILAESTPMSLPILDSDNV